MKIKHLLLLAAIATSGCGTINKLLDNDQAIDYKSAKTARTLEVPPDLTQLRSNERYVQTQTGLSSSSLGGSSSNAAVNPAVLPTSGKARLERLGANRYLVVDMPAEQVYPITLAFWRDLGFAISTENQQTGVIETDWAENRGKGPQSAARRMLGGIFDGLFDSGDRDKYRTRLERVGAGTEIYLSHNGTRETNVGDRTQANFKQLRRDGDVELENEFLRRLMLRFGVDERTAKQATSVAIAPVADRARLLSVNNTLEIDDNFDTAWRRVGLALDRSGFTIEDRNFATGEYFIRYARDLNESKEGFFSRIFSSNKQSASRKLKLVLQKGTKTNATVQTEAGAAVDADIRTNLLTVLRDELR